MTRPLRTAAPVDSARGAVRTSGIAIEPAARAGCEYQYDYRSEYRGGVK
jgi:hypothetical protein